MKLLLIGVGNPGRQDDGLGPALAEALEGRGIDGLTLDSDYQLTVEDSAAVAEHDVVVFADADAVGPEPFSFRPLEPAAGLGFSSHGIEPCQVLALCEQVFGRRPQAWLLGIRGYAFDELREELTPKARENLAEALAFIERSLRTRAFAAHPDDEPAPGSPPRA